MHFNPIQICLYETLFVYLFPQMDVSSVPYFTAPVRYPRTGAASFV
nr:MAG TPA: hypothetical protein [Caudoviricetes sp.]